MPASSAVAALEQSVFRFPVQFLRKEVKPASDRPSRCKQASGGVGMRPEPVELFRHIRLGGKEGNLHGNATLVEVIVLGQDRLQTALDFLGLRFDAGLGKTRSVYPEFRNPVDVPCQDISERIALRLPRTFERGDKPRYLLFEGSSPFCEFRFRFAGAAQLPGQRNHRRRRVARESDSGRRRHVLNALRGRECRLHTRAVKS